ncbi:MAG: GIY-YIG nuclease family protein [Rhodospirillaceae bacterium]|jgi:hypothetical protein|nr:GIY-YIG nuclease family protein [Rhodospirillaceae bacterium]
MTDKKIKFLRPAKIISSYLFPLALSFSIYLYEYGNKKFLLELNSLGQYQVGSLAINFALSVLLVAVAILVFLGILFHFYVTKHKPPLIKFFRLSAIVIHGAYLICVPILIFSYIYLHIEHLFFGQESRPYLALVGIIYISHVGSFFSIFLSTAPSGFEKTKVIEETESRPKTTGDINVSPEPTLGPSRTTSFSATVSNESVSYSDLSKDDTVGSDSLREEPTEKVPVEKNDKVDLDFLNSLIERSAGASSTQAPFVLKEEKPQKKSNSGVKNKRKKNGSKRNSTPQKRVKTLETPTRLYVVQTPFREPNGNVVIKIGESTNIEERMKTFKFYWRDKFKIMALAPGKVKDEAEVHKVLLSKHIGGEYFSVDPKQIPAASPQMSKQTLLNWVGEILYEE